MAFIARLDKSIAFLKSIPNIINGIITNNKYPPDIHAGNNEDNEPVKPLIGNTNTAIPNIIATTIANGINAFINEPKFTIV